MLAMQPRSHSETQSATVLVVDDDPDARTIATRVLQLEGYGVIEADSAARALECISARRVDLVILDLTLPGVSGLDLLTALRRRHDIPVLIVSGNNDVNTRIVGLRIGADDYLVKPAVPAEISARVAALLRRTRSKPPTKTLQFDHLVIDGEARQVRVRGELVELTPKEFELLYFLAQSPRRAYSRNEILEKVWNSSADWQQAATVTEHIRKLRAKVEDDPAHPRFISTVRNVGYRFDP